MIHTSLHTFLTTELNGLFCVQGQLLETLPRMKLASTDEGLKKVFELYIQNTRDQLDRITDLAIELDIELLVQGSYAMESLIHEGEKRIFGLPDPSVKDSAIIAMIRKIIHYQMAAYDSSASLALDCSLKNVEEKLRISLREEVLANNSFKKFASGTFLNTGKDQEAAMAS